jgi:GntR family transcriptional repressor for pyruvate dehydrogenase complex
MITSNPLSSIERPTLSAQVARHLLALINSEQLRPGDAVPSEVRIGLDLQVSRGSVREAYRSLAALGILEIEGGRKPRLRLVDASVLAQVFDYALNTAQVSLAHVLETRRAIELQTAQLAARYASDDQRQRLRALASQMRSAGNNHGRRAECDAAIHHLIAAASGNPLNSLLLGALGSPVEASARMHLAETRTETDLVRVIDAHDAIVDRICAGDPLGAQSAMSYHFDLALVHVQRQGDRAMEAQQGQHSSPAVGHTAGDTTPLPHPS